MYLILVLFSLGVLISCQLPILPAAGSSYWLCFAGFLASALRITSPVAGLLFGLAYTFYLANVWSDHRVPRSLEGEPVLIEGIVSGLPVRRSNGWRFQFVVENGPLHGRKLSLGWYEENPPFAGERWQLQVKLSRNHGRVNSGLFDYEAWLLSQGVHGTGYVTHPTQSRKLSEVRLLDGYQKWRYRLGNRVGDQVLGSRARGMVIALLLGDSNQLTPAVWNTLSATGTNHLLIVSGLHVSLVTALFFWFWRRAVRVSPPVAVFLTSLGAVGYSLVTGFGLPVQRALVMSLVGLLVLTSRRETSVWHALALALAAVLVLNPFASLTAGFWLSFAAVTGLLAGFAGVNWSNQVKVFALAKTQWMAFIATMPLLLCWVFKVSLMSVVGNLIAIPIVSLAIVPLILLFMIVMMFDGVQGISVVAESLLLLVAFFLEQLLQILEYLESFGWVFHHPVSNGWALWLAVLGSSTLLCPPRTLPRWMGLICWLPLLTVSPISREDIPLRVDILDVGQGLSVIVSSPTAVILYDAGPAGGRFDAGEQIVLPMLRRLGARQLDLLVVSHGDNDHAGGVAAVRRGLPVLETVSEGLGLPCHQPRAWHFQDLSVRLFVPGANQNLNHRNDLSCVVLIQVGEISVLLPGDIESAAEYALIREGIGSVDLVVAPHHGSISSSTPAFINQFDPAWVVHSAGYLSRFGHPDPIIVNRYHNRGIRQFNVAHSGALTFNFFEQGSIEVQQARLENPRFWYDPPPPRRQLVRKPFD
ncbi:MAG: competence protein ComEC [Candidatus Azotimanducaceae bacterium]|jgi:competence protein ComEC